MDVEYPIEGTPDVPIDELYINPRQVYQRINITEYSFQIIDQTDGYYEYFNIISDKPVFKAQIRNGVLNGVAIFYSQAGLPIRYGNYVDNVLTGKCKLYENGKLAYHGETKDNLKHGHGCLYTDQFVYEGEFKDDTMYGHGQITYGTNAWVGEFKNGKLNGHGRETRDGTLTYDGEYKDGRWCGMGKKYVDGRLYVEGTFWNGRLDGPAKMYYTQNDVESVKFEGIFAGYKILSGKRYNLDGVLYYEGEFLRQKYHGQGTLYHGIYTYVGMFTNGELVQGIKYKDNLILYDGQFKNMLYHGQGCEYNADTGKVEYIGQFEFGKYAGKGVLYVNGQRVDTRTGQVVTEHCCIIL